MQLFEKMVNARLAWFLETRNHPSPVQYGFQHSHFTIDALVQLEATLYRTFASRQYVVSVFLDLENAYDTTWRYGMTF